MGTHSLETVSGETSQDMESIRPTERHSPTGDGIGETSQDTERIRASEGYSLSGDGIGRDKSAHRKHPSERGALTT